ncbi:Fn3-like domain-containing protein [Mycena kentingensis (nom. inval.)]|nr:Fn3-like domain-containing protein [Mycena kentingensis (nom. inval.)]
MSRLHAFFALLAAIPVLGDVVTGIPDPAPKGFEQWISPIVLPAPPTQGSADWADAVAKAREYVVKLTLDEKINVTTGVDIQGRCIGNTGAITRLGWKGLCLNDSPLGVRFADFVSAFPAAINAAATWDLDLIRRRGKALGEEHRGKGVNVALAPMTNMARVAAGGRNWEGFGADPFLSGAATAATIAGMQSVGVMATVKHLIANEQEHFRGQSLAKQVYSSNIDDRTMHEIYAYPFSEAVKAGVVSVMCSYNNVNQTQACQNSKLINGILKGELGFQGFIMSDWAALIDGLQPALAGLDMNMPGFFGYDVGDQNQPNPSKANNSFWGAALAEMVRNGSVPESRLDDMVIRTFAAYFKLGQDKDYPPVSFSQLTNDDFLNGERVNEHINVQSDHYKLIREIGAASAILLKNAKNALPLRVKNLRRMVSVFLAPMRESIQTALIAAPSLFSFIRASQPFMGCNRRRCDQGTLAMGFGSGVADFPYLVDPLSAISHHIYSINPTVVVDAITNDYNLARIETVAAYDDACLVFVNADSGEAFITIDGNVGDRNNLTLWHGGEALIKKTASVCSNTIVIMHAVGAITVESWFDHPNVTAVISAHLPGQETGNAIVDVLFCDGPHATNPSGRLPYTVAKQRSDYPADVLYKSASRRPQINYDEGLFVDYRWFEKHGIEPRFEFGFGLSYTTFEYGDLVVGVKQHSRRAASTASASTSVSSPTPSSSSAPPSSSPPASTTSAPSVISSPVGQIGGPAALYEDIATVSFTVTNTGAVAGNEVSQLYLGFPDEYDEPAKVLRGFARTMIGSGKTKRVRLQLRVKDVSVWDVVRQDWVTVKGTVKVYVGASSKDIRLSGSFVL